MRSLTYRTAHATWWSALEITARYGVQFAVTVFLARMLTPGDFGLIAMLVVFTALGTILTEAGLGAALIQRPTIDQRDETTAFCCSMVSALVLASTLWLSADAIATIYHQPPLTPLAKAMAWIFPLVALGTVPDALLMRRLDFKARAYAQILASVASGVVGISMAAHGFGIWSLVVQALASAGLRSLSLWSLSRWRPRGHFSTTSLRNLLGFGGYLLVSGVLNTISMRIQTFALGRVFDAGTLGHYSLAQDSADAPKGLMGGVLGRVGLPVFSQIAHDRALLRNALQRALRVSMFLFVPSMTGLALTSRQLIELVYGAQWSPAAPVFSLLAVAGILWPIHLLNLAALNAQGRSDRFLILELLKNAIVVGAVLLTARWGPVAVASAMVFSGIASAGINAWYTRRMLGYGLIAQLMEQWPTYLLTVAALSPAWIILRGSSTSLTHTLSAIFVATLVYVTLAAGTRCCAWEELRQILRQLTVSTAPADSRTP